MFSISRRRKYPVNAVFACAYNREELMFLILVLILIQRLDDHWRTQRLASYLLERCRFCTSDKDMH
jgi:hypothetical protein